MRASDIQAVAKVHGAAFPRQTHSVEWVQANFRAFPRIQYCVAESDGELCDYIEWIQKSGFRPEVVLELEQIAVSPHKQGNGIGRELIAQSLPLVSAELESRGAHIKHVIVTTRADNRAQRLYGSALGAKVEATISQLYSADEVIMVARNINHPSWGPPGNSSSRR